MTEINSVSEKYIFHNVGHQILAAIVVNLAIFGLGCNVGWMSPAISHLIGENTPFPDGPLTVDQISWVVSMPAIGGIFGSIISGYLTSRLGSKKSTLLLAIPGFSFWVIVIFTQSYYFLLIARFLSGYAGGGLFTTIVLFIAEISNDEIRGALGTISQLARNLGILAAYTAGAFFSYDTLPLLFISFPIVFLIFFSLLPNTPQYLLSRNNLTKAKKSLKFYKGCKGKTVEESMAISREFERLKCLELKRSHDEKIHWSDLCESQAIKGLTIAIVLPFLNQISGVNTFMMYASHIFSSTNVGIDPNLSAVLLGIAQLLGNLFTTKLADTIGRKILINISLAGCALSLMATAIYFYFESQGYDLKSIRWTPVISLSFSIFIGSAGIIPLTNISTVEALPPKIRTFGITSTTIAVNIFAFIISKYFPILSEVIHMHGCFGIMSIMCIFGILFVHFVMDETKGQCLDNIGCNKNENIDNLKLSYNSLSRNKV